MTLYISGPMTGLPDYNRAAFMQAARDLRRAGFRVINPARQPAGKSWTWYMIRDLAAVERADGVAQLEGWERSRGAQIEFHAAKYHDKKIATVAKWYLAATGEVLP